MKTLEDLRYPIGPDRLPKQIGEQHIQSWIATLERFPEQVEGLVSKLSQHELNFKYRPQGWTVKQVVHHCADSHMNALIRFKLALTEDKPIIKPYQEARWANLSDSQNDDLSDSLAILKGLHARWTACVKDMSETDMARVYVHPEQEAAVPLKEALGHYDWHSRHHLAHIEQALSFKNDFSDIG